MTRQIINVGVADKGNGDPIRTAFIKANANFAELYNILSNNTGGSIITTDIIGSVFADDSTLLVDGINGSIPYSVLSGAPTIPAAQVQSNWTAASGMGVILNKPTLFSGSYTDLTNKPTAFSFSVAADDSTQRAISSNESIKFIGSGGITTASDAEGNITITGASSNITNTHSGSATLAVGDNIAIRDQLSIRVTNNSNTLDLEINYQNPNNTVAVSVYREYPVPFNLYSGTTNKASGNTTWNLVGNLPVAGDSIGFTLTDHSFQKVYRVIVVAKIMPGVSAAGEAFCIIEELK